MKQYTITCNEEQLRLIESAVEDWGRFLSGQCELHNATSMIRPSDAYRECVDILEKQVRPLVVPELIYPGSSYSWDGGDCPNEHQRKAIAMSYGIYRQILHFFAKQRDDGSWNAYTSPTLTCEEQGPLIQIEQINK